MRKISTIATRQSLVQAAMLRHPAGSAVPRSSKNLGRHPGGDGCPVCGGRRWVRAVTEMPLEIACPACEVTR